MLRRQVKVLCWRESSKVCFQQNGEIIGSGRSYSYKQEWVSMTDEDFVDSSGFHDKAYDQNKRADVKSRDFICSSARVGPYKVDAYELIRALGWKPYPDLFKYEDPVARVDPDGIWSFDEKSSSLIRQKVPGEDTIGDLKVSYEVLDADFDDKREVQMSACGVGKGDKLVRFEELKAVVCEHYTSKKDFIKRFAR